MDTTLILIAVLGAVQALLLGIALLCRRENAAANRALAALLFAMAVYLGNGAYQLAGLVPMAPVFFRWAHPMPLLFGPLLYLYARFATDASRRWRRRELWHFAPAIALVIWSLPVYLLTGAEKVALFDAVREGKIPATVEWNLTVGLWAKIISGVVYTGVTIRILALHRVAIRRQYSTLDRVALDWLLALVATNVVAWGVALTTRLVEPWGLVAEGTGDRIIAIAMVIVTYAIGYRGLQQSPTVRADLADVEEPDAGLGRKVAADPDPTDDRSPVSPRMAVVIERELTLVMERDQPWRDAELTLAGLAERVGTTTHKLSAVLNAHRNESFHDYVNGFRVRDVQRQLRQPSSAGRSLLDLAFDAGFASKSTFNAVFRRLVGTTPSAYRKQMTASEAVPDVQTDPSARPV